MKKNASKVLQCAVLGVLMVLTTSCACFKQGEYPRIVLQPEHQVVKEGSSATFSVSAKNGPIHYQWQKNGKDIPGATNSTFTIRDATRNDVGPYSVLLMRGDETVPSKGAELYVYTLTSQGGTNELNVFGQPSQTGGTITPPCPGTYVGSVSYRKLPPLCGWYPQNIVGAVHTACDNNRADTKVKFFSCVDNENGCATHCVTIPHKPSKPYRFTVYFPTGPIGGTGYPLTLTGFNP
jgi:hypothetical protein